MSSLLHDIRYALRIIVRDRTFSATVVLTLGLCIGANAAIFTVVNAVLLRPLPFAGADRLVWVENSYPGAGVVDADNSVPDYYDRRDGVAAFEHVAIYRNQGRTVGTTAGAERMSIMEVTPSIFQVLRVSPHRGRVFTEQDGERGQHQKTILSYALWQQQFGGEDTAIGSDLRLNGVPHTVVGVMPPDFSFVDPAVRLWTPLSFTPQERSDEARHNNSFQMVGRLKPEATLQQAQQQIDAINAAQLARSPLRQPLIDVGFTTRAAFFRERLVKEVRPTLFLLWGGVVFVLLIGVVNVTNLTLVRATARAREFATRQALGAGAWRLTRQLLTESIMLSAFAGALGLIVGSAIVGAIAAAAEDQIPRAHEIALGAGTVLFTLAVTVVAGALVALIPLVHVRRASIAQVIREEGRSGTAGRGTKLVRRGLVTAQVAFAFMLLIGAGLLLASFQAVLGVNPGFQPGGVMTGRISLPASKYADDPQIVATYRRLLERVRALPGVAAAGFSTSAPFTGSYSDSVILAEGYMPPPGEPVVSPAQNEVTAGYFEALRIPLKRGRFIDDRDTADSQKVIVVDERLANRFWPGQDPIGKRMFLPNSSEEFAKGPGPGTDWLTVVGVVGDVRQRGLVSDAERIGAYYLAHSQQAAQTMTLIVRVQNDPQGIVAPVRRELAAIDPEVPLYSVLSMEERVQASVAGRRSAMMLAVGFGLIALMLATVGIYGVLAYQVTQRTREIGIRMALGSDTRSVFAMILREGAALLGLGFAIGLAGAFGMRRVMAGQLYGVDPMEPAVLGAVAGLLALVALAACALPARRAAHIDPVIALAE